MGGEWRDTTVGEFAPFLYGKGLPEVRRRRGSVPVYGSNGVVGFHSESLLSGPAVIIGRKGSVGAVHYCPGPCWPIDTTFYVVDVVPQRLRFKYYVLKSLGLEHMNADSAVPGLNRDAAHAQVIKVPSFPEQRAIAHILGTLDDRIELNRRMSETLEAMARALFKSWFVDFDPVRAKAAVRRQHPKWSDEQVSRAACPNLKPEIARLFPDSFENSELGEIPRGWRIQRLADVIDIFDSRRVPLSGRQRAERQGPYPYYGAAGVMDSVDDFLFEGVHVLLGEDGSVVKADGRPYTQYVWGKFWVNNHAHVLRGRCITSEILLVFLDQCDVAPFVTGAVQPKLSQGNLKKIPFIDAGNTLLRLFGEIVDPLFAQIRDATEESRTLAALRDALLPKLISGQLRVKDADKFLQERGL